MEPFFPVTFNSDSSELLCSPEHGKLCFEQLVTYSEAQNYLPYRETENLRSRFLYGLSKDELAKARLIMNDDGS